MAVFINVCFKLVTTGMVELFDCMVELLDYSKNKKNIDWSIIIFLILLSSLFDSDNLINRARTDK